MENKYIAPGPVFEARPGWGGKIKKWAKKYILGGNCTLCRATRYVLIFGIIFLAIAWPKLNTPARFDLFRDSRSNLQENKIVETVQPKDGKTHLARRMLAQYLEQNPEIKTTEAQKVFIETTLRKKVASEIVIGQTIEIGSEEIKQAVAESQLLTPLQLKKWEFYAEAVDL